MKKADFVNEIYLEKHDDMEWVDRNLGVNEGDAYADAITRALKDKKLSELKKIYKTEVKGKGVDLNE